LRLKGNETGKSQRQRSHTGSDFVGRRIRARFHWSTFAASPSSRRSRAPCIRGTIAVTP